MSHFTTFAIPTPILLKASSSGELPAGVLLIILFALLQLYQIKRWYASNFSVFTIGSGISLHPFHGIKQGLAYQKWMINQSF